MMTYQERMKTYQEVENAFEIMKADLAERNASADLIPVACIGVAKAVIHAMLIRLEDPKEKQHYLDLILNAYKW